MRLVVAASLLAVAARAAVPAASADAAGSSSSSARAYPRRSAKANAKATAASAAAASSPKHQQQQQRRQQQTERLLWHPDNWEGVVCLPEQEGTTLNATYSDDPYHYDPAACGVHCRHLHAEPAESADCPEGGFHMDFVLGGAGEREIHVLSCPDDDVLSIKFAQGDGPANLTSAERDFLCKTADRVEADNIDVMDNPDALAAHVVRMASILCEWPEGLDLHYVYEDDRGDDQRDFDLEEEYNLVSDPPGYGGRRGRRGLLQGDKGGSGSELAERAARGHGQQNRRKLYHEHITDMCEHVYDFLIPEGFGYDKFSAQVGPIKWCDVPPSKRGLHIYNWRNEDETDADRWSCVAASDLETHSYPEYVVRNDNIIDIDFAVGDCFGRCGAGCGSGRTLGSYTLDCADLDFCRLFAIGADDDGTCHAAFKRAIDDWMWHRNCDPWHACPVYPEDCEYERRSFNDDILNGGGPPALEEKSAVSEEPPSVTEEESYEELMAKCKAAQGSCESCVAAGCAYQGPDNCFPGCLISDTGCYDTPQLCDAYHIQVRDRDLCSGHATCEDCVKNIKTDGSPCAWFSESESCSDEVCPFWSLKCGDTTCDAAEPPVAVEPTAAPESYEDAMAKRFDDCRAAQGSCESCVAAGCAYIEDDCIPDCSMIADTPCFTSGQCESFHSMVKDRDDGTPAVGGRGGDSAAADGGGDDMDAWSDNLLPDGGFELGDSAVPKWQPFGSEGFSVTNVNRPAGGGKKSALVSGVGPGVAGGAKVVVPLEAGVAPAGSTLRIRGYSKSAGVSENLGHGDYALYADVTYAGGIVAYGLLVANFMVDFEGGTHNWEKGVAEAVADYDVDSVAFHVLYRNDPKEGGKVWFDDLSLQVKTVDQRV